MDNMAAKEEDMQPDSVVAFHKATKTKAILVPWSRSREVSEWEREKSYFSQRSFGAAAHI